MKYLYGNSNESNLDQNYLDFLRRAIDFSAAVLQSENTIAALRSGIVQAQENAKVEHEQLVALAGKVDAVLATATDTNSRETTVACRNSLQIVAQNEISRTDATIAANMQSIINASNAKISTERISNLKRFEDVLLYCDLPGTKQFLTVFLNENSTYEASLESISQNTIFSAIELEIPSGHVLSEPLRLDKIMPELQISIPDAGGWLKRSSKISLQKLNKEYVYALRQRANENIIELRSSLKDNQDGYNIFFKADAVFVTRISKQQESQPYELTSEDARSISALFVQLFEAAYELENNRKSLTSVKINNTPLEAFPQPDQLILWLIEQMTPVVIDISKNSLSPTELVLKRVLSDDRREEIFASKAELYEKLSSLTPEQKAYFTSLGLNVDNQSLKGLPAPILSDLGTVAEETQAQYEDEMVLIESSVDDEDLLKDDPTSEIYLEEVTEAPKAAAAPPRPDMTSMPPRPSMPPSRPSNVPPGPSVSVPPPRPSKVPAPGSKSSNSSSASKSSLFSGSLLEKKK